MRNTYTTSIALLFCVVVSKQNHPSKHVLCLKSLSSVYAVVVGFVCSASLFCAVGFCCCCLLFAAATAVAFVVVAAVVLVLVVFTVVLVIVFVFFVYGLIS